MGLFILFGLIAAASISSTVIGSPLANNLRSSELDVRAVDPPAGFAIISTGVNGSGCPNGASRIRVGDDKKTLQFDFDKWTAKAGPGVEISEIRKNCIVSLSVRVPAGYAFSVAGLTGWENFSLDSGVSASETVYYYFQGQVAQGSQTTTFPGPLREGKFTYHYGFDQTIYSPCGTSTVLNVNADVAILNGGGSGSGTVTRTWDKIELQWIKC